MLRNPKSHQHKSKEKNVKEQQQLISGNTLRCSVKWFLVQRTGTIAFRLNPCSVILIGREECDINVQSPSVEKRHAVLCFDPNSESFSVKDLNSTNGTFLNNRRISSDRPEKLNNMDLLRFGYDSNLYEIRLGSASGPGVQQNEQHNNVNYSPTGEPGFSCGIPLERFPHVMQQQQRGNSLYGSRVSSPSLTLDSGRGSSPLSSPAKEMSPVPTSSNIQISPSLSRKMTKQTQQEITNTSKKEGSTRLTFSSQNPGHQRRALSLEDEINNVIDTTVFPKRSTPTLRSSSAIMSDLGDDLNVPNEVFDKHLQPQGYDPSEEEDPIRRLSHNNRPDGMSRPRSFSGDSLNGNALPSLTSAPSPLYGTPDWWPHEQHSLFPNDCADEHDVVVDDEPPSCSQIIKDERTNMTLRDNMEQISLSSEKSLDSDTQSDAMGNEKKKVSPMAFTVDFDDGPKKFGIADSISKFAPRHRRNLSLTKVEDAAIKKDKDDSSKKDSTSLTIGLGRLALSKTVVESEIKTGSSATVSKNSNNKTAKQQSSDNRSDSNVETESSSSSSKKSRNEFSSSKLKKPNPTLSSLFSSRLQSTKEISNAIANEASSYDTRSKTNNNNKKSQSVDQKSEKFLKKGVVQNENTLLVDKEDASSETGTYTIEKDNPDVEKARKDIENMLGIEEKNCDSGISADVDAAVHSEHTGPEWVREWAEQAAIQHKRIKDLNPLITDTQLFLQETENVVSAMQERVTRNLSNNNSSQNSDSDDEATLSHSPPKILNRFKRPISSRTSPLPRESSVLSDSGYQIGYQSDSSNEGLREYKNIGAVKMNKAFNIRRGRVVGYESDGCTATALNRHSLTLPIRGTSPRPSTSSGIPPTSTNATFARNDGGRYSLRMPKSRTPPNLMPLPPMVAPPRSSPAAGPRMTKSNNSPLVVDNNANRRQAPQTTNTMSRKPPSGSRSNSTLTAKEVELANWRRRKTYDPMRAAAAGRKKKETNSSATENSVDDLSPTSLSKHSAAVMSKSMSFHLENNNYNPKCHSAEDEEDMIYVVDEMDSSHSNSPIHLPMSRSSHDENQYYGLSHSHSSAMRPKNKLEALDNLVIATIHSLSNKVRTSSRQLLQKLQIQHADNENGALLEEMVSQLKELEVTNSNSSPTKSPSRELSGTLKNLKKLEQVVLVLDRVLCDDSGSDVNI